MKWSSSLLASLILLALACTEPVPMEDEAPEPPPPLWTATADTEIGDESSAEYALTRIGDLVVTSGGHLVVSQPQEGRLRVFDGEGSFLRYIGRNGEGPGEFRRYPSSLAIRGDTLWVSDGGGRMHAFNIDGENLTTVTTGYRAPDPYLTTGGYHRMGDGTVLVEGSALLSDIVSGQVTDMPIFRFSADGTLLGALPGWSGSRVVVIEALPFVAGNRSIPQEAFAMVPHSMTAWVAVAPNAREVVRATYAPQGGESVARPQFHLVRIALNGDTVASRTLSYTPVPIPEATKQQALDSIAESLASRTGGAARARRALQAAGFMMPEAYPPITDLVVATDDRVWLALTEAPQDSTGVTRWLVLDRDLATLALVDLPRGFDLYLASSADLWGVVVSDLDVPRLVRYRISN